MVTPALSFDVGRPSEVADLSRQIEQALGREPDDRVRCVRVFDNFYRCNWWSPSPRPSSDNTITWATGSTHHVRKSLFLTATLDAGVLSVREL